MAKKPAPAKKRVPAPTKTPRKRISRPVSGFKPLAMDNFKPLENKEVKKASKEGKLMETIERSTCFHHYKKDSEGKISIEIEMKPKKVAKYERQQTDKGVILVPIES